MAISTKISIEIDGVSVLRFAHLELKQEILHHHEFTLAIPVHENEYKDASNKSLDYVGKQIIIKIASNNTKTESDLHFVGVVTQSEMLREFGAATNIVLKGNSPTIFLDGSKNTISYTDKNLSTIAQEVLQPYGQLKSVVKIQSDKTMPYTVQYNESDFEFLKRQAKKRGQWMYYNGEELYFGKGKSKSFKLTYGVTLSHLNIKSQVVPLEANLSSYNPDNSGFNTISASTTLDRIGGMASNMYSPSNRYPEVLGPNLAWQSPEEDLSQKATINQEKQISKLKIINGTSVETGLRIGDSISINEQEFSFSNKPGGNGNDYGSFLITKLVHTVNEIGTYENQLEGLALEAKVPPYANINANPIAPTQTAEVIDNNDTAGMGRVKVAFPWQKASGLDTPWLRLVNPHAGDGKGMYFIPEIGENVLVGFENGNAEKPYVLGTMYHGNSLSSYHTAGNDQKVIHTRSGTKMIMNDAIGSIFIEDPSGNTWFMDGKGNISVNAPKNFTVHAGENITMTAGKDVSVSAGEDITNSANNNITSVAGNDINQTATGDIKETSDQRTEIVQKNFTRIADYSNEIASEAKLFSEKENLTIQSGKTVEFNSAEKSKLF
jgi:type VI secretion system secreted protein VgrG